ncbi:MAG: type II secretion system protein [Verrucomicrobia bacterium]|nr:type II secretion system protein [Verrucomicrobiota bacterium]
MLVSPNAEADNSKVAFALAALLVVIAIIAVLAGLLLPAVAKAKAKAHGIQCLNNGRNLTLAWLMYADDHDGRLSPNRSNEVGGTWVVDLENRRESAQIISFPANYHNGAASVNFADGHSEAHKWLDEHTKCPNLHCGCLSEYASKGLFKPTPHNPDLAWLPERTSSRVR